MKQSKESFMTIEQVCEFIMNTQDRSKFNLRNLKVGSQIKLFSSVILKLISLN